MITKTIQKYDDICDGFYSLIRTKTFQDNDSDLSNYLNDFNKLKNYIEEEKLENNSLFVSKLHEKYVELSFRVYSFSEDEHLKNLFELFEKVYPQEAQQIKKYWNVYSFSKGNKHLLLKGDIQSGKTAMMILTTLCYLVCGRDVVIILRTSNDDKIQFMERFNDIVSKIREMGYTNKNFQTFDVGSKIVRPKEDKCCFVTIYRVGKDGGYMKKLQNILQLRSKDFVLYVDEADQRDDGKDLEFIKLRKLSSTSIFVSGTIQDILVSDWEIYGSNLIELTPNSNYKGVDDVKWITEWDNSTEEGVYWSICDIANSSDNIWEDVYPYHPKIVLVTTSTKIKMLNYYYKQFQKTTNVIIPNYPIPKGLENPCVIKYGDKGIRLYHNSFINQIFDDKDFQPTLHNRTEITFNDSSKMTIKKVLLWMAKNGGKIRFPNIIILAGKKADRGINFACYDEDNYENNWHVTHQILSKNSEAKCSTLLQSLRILGKFTDDISLKVYTSKDEKNKILRSFSLTNSLINCISDETNEFYREEFKQTTSDNICKMIPIKKRSISSNYIKKPIRSSFNIVSNYEYGLDISESEVKRNSMRIEILTQNEIEIMKTKIISWNHNKSTKISKVLSELYINLEYTKDEIIFLMRKHNLSIESFVHLTTFEHNGTNGYGKILRNNHNCKFQIYPELNDIFTQTFMNK